MHCHDRMAQRDISKKEIAKALKNGRALKSYGNTVKFTSPISKKRAITVVADKESKTIITTYERNKQSKNFKNSPDKMAFKNRKRITNEVILDPITGLDKAIHQAISDKDTILLTRLLNLGAPYNAQSKTVAIALAHAIEINDLEIVSLILCYVSSIKQIQKILKHKSYNNLSSNSEIYKMIKIKVELLGYSNKYIH